MSMLKNYPYMQLKIYILKQILETRTLLEVFLQIHLRIQVSNLINEYYLSIADNYQVAT